MHHFRLSHHINLTILDLCMLLEIINRIQSNYNSVDFFFSKGWIWRSGSVNDTACAVLGPCHQGHCCHLLRGRERHRTAESPKILPCWPFQAQNLPAIPATPGPVKNLKSTMFTSTPPTKLEEKQRSQQFVTVMVRFSVICCRNAANTF